MSGGAGAAASRISTMTLPSPLRALLRAVLLALFAFAIFGPLLNLVLWAFAERWYFPNKLPLEYGLTFWYRVFQPRGNALASLGTSVWIAVLTVIVSLAVAVPAGYALARLRLPWRSAILLAFLLPQVRGTLLVGLVLSFVTMLSVLSVPLMINPNSPTMITVDVAYRINTFADYAVANALCLLSLLLAALGAAFYLRHAVQRAGASTS